MLLYAHLRTLNGGGCPMDSSHETLKKLQIMRKDLKKFTQNNLKVRTKAGTKETLELNRAQLHVHEQLEQQIEDIGMVRALILKGRQQGISTYVAARFYWKTSLNYGRNTYILAHDQSASDTLFGIVDRYHANNPLAPHVGKSNAKELEFDKLDSSYAVATAGQKAGGRGKALTYFHGSEVAFWPNAAEHFAASVQGVPSERGSEVILESTSAGASGEYYDRCQEAVVGEGDYRLIFLPWWWSDEYQRDPPPNFVLSREEIDGNMSEEEYSDTFKLNMRQMAWRRAKMQELRDPLLFRREYPATIEDAWTAPPGHEPFISALTVLRARKRTQIGVGPLVLGVDPASSGGDRFAITARRGLKVEWQETRKKVTHEEAVAWISDLIDQHHPARVNIDMGNIGANIVASLKMMKPHYVKIVRGVNFGACSEWRMARPQVPGPYNRRAEMYDRLNEWLLMDGSAIPDDSALQADLVAAKRKYRTDQFWLLESKKELKDRGVKSPDLGDSLALTFAFNEFLRDYHQPASVQSYGNIDAENHNMIIDEDEDVYGGSTSYGWMS